MTHHNDGCCGHRFRPPNCQSRQRRRHCTCRFSCTGSGRRLLLKSIMMVMVVIAAMQQQQLLLLHTVAAAFVISPAAVGSSGSSSSRRSIFSTEGGGGTNQHHHHHQQRRRRRQRQLSTRQLHGIPISQLQDFSATSVPGGVAVIMTSVPSSIAATVTAILSTTTSITTIVPSVVSALLTYLALLLYYDRPRGELHPQIHSMVQVRPSQNIPQPLQQQQTLQQEQESAQPQQQQQQLGVHCIAKSIPKGTILGTYPGVIVPMVDTPSYKLRQYPQCETYIWRFADNQYIIDPTWSNGMIADTCGGGNPNTILSVWFHETIVPFLFHNSNTNDSTTNYNNPFLMKSTLLSRINEPPKGLDVNVITMEDCYHRTVTFVTERTIYKDEELFIDYGLYYDRSNYNNNNK